MKHPRLFMAGLCLMAVSLSGCIIIADNSPEPKSVHITTIKKDTTTVVKGD